jgi:hypothetical protein
MQTKRRERAKEKQKESEEATVLRKESEISKKANNV